MAVPQYVPVKKCYDTFGFTSKNWGSHNSIPHKEALFVKEASKLQNAEEILEIPISYVEKGRKEGREEGLKKVALNMLKDGFSIERIAELTQMDRDDIEKLKKQL